jgi:hypothetical protein
VSFGKLTRSLAMSQDARDLRDPQKIGKMLQMIREWNPKGLLSDLVDQYKDSLNTAEIYPQDELLSTVTQREYREELQQAAKEGDKYAAERLRELSV